MSDIPCNECKYENNCFSALKLAQKFKNICKQSHKRLIRQQKPAVAP